MISKKTQNLILERIGALVSGKAKELCPFDKGDLIQSIKYKVEGNLVTIYSDLDYAEDMEYGRPPEPLSETEKQDLTEWAHRHGTNPKTTIKNIEQKGIKVGTETNPLHVTSLGRDSYRPFLKPAGFESIADMRQIIMEEIKNGN